MHQTANSKVRHQQSIKLLAYQFGSLAAQYDLCAPQMRLEFIERRLYFPALMIESRQFPGRSLPWIQNRGDEPVNRLGVIDTLQPVIDHSHHDAFAPVPAIGSGTVDATQVRTVPKTALYIQTGVLARPPQQRRARAAGLLPEFVTRKETVSQTEHALRQRGYDLFGQFEFVGGIVGHASGEQNVCSVL